jgi:hypothetical protein
MILYKEKKIYIYNLKKQHKTSTNKLNYIVLVDKDGTLLYNQHPLKYNYLVGGPVVRNLS